MVNQVLRENSKHNERKCNESSSSLRKCCRRRTKLRDKFDAVLKTMEVVTDAQSHRKLEQRLQALQTSLDTVKRSITKFEDLIEDCQLVEEELRQIEEDEARQEELHQIEEDKARQEEEETADVEMVDEEERSNPEYSGPCREADTDGIPPLVSAGDTVSPEEEAILLDDTPQPEDPATGSHSPRSKTGAVSERWPS